jgi:hypothetical protein
MWKIYGGEKWNWESFSPNTSSSACHYHSTNASQISFLFKQRYIHIALNLCRYALVFTCPVTSAVNSGVIGIFVFNLCYSLGKKERNTAPFVVLVHCRCNEGQQTSDHIIFECHVLKAQRSNVIKQIMVNGGPWPPPKEELITKHLQAFLSFVKLIDFKKFN